MRNYHLASDDVSKSETLLRALRLTKFRHDYADGVIAASAVVTLPT